MADNETPEVGTFDALDTSPEGHVLDWSGLTDDDEMVTENPEETTAEALQRQSVAELAAIRELLQVQVAQFG